MFEGSLRSFAKYEIYSFIIFGGGREIRTPAPIARPNGFQDRSLKPLEYTSVKNSFHLLELHVYTCACVRMQSVYSFFLFILYHKINQMYILLFLHIVYFQNNLTNDNCDKALSEWVYFQNKCFFRYLSKFFKFLTKSII